MDNAELSMADIEKTLEDYNFNTFNTSEPFDLLLSIDDEVSRQRVLIAMRDKAKKCSYSVKNFDESWKAALARKKREDREEAEEAKRIAKEEKLKALEDENLEGLAEKLDGNIPSYGKYHVSRHSIMYVNGFGIPVKVCSHPIFPTRRYVNIETGSELLDISYMMDGRWKTLKLIERKTITQSKTIVSLSEYGLDITSENAREVVNYLAEVDQLNRGIIPRREMVRHLGWIQGRGFSPYIEGVDYDSGGKFEDTYRAVHSEGSIEEWKFLVASIMNGREYLPTRIVLAASVASVLLRWTCQQPFITHLWSSESGTGKTIATMLAASVWADPELGKFIKSMNATKVANEQLAGFCNNLPLLLDELQTVQKNTDFDDIIYMLCEGTGKARGSRDGGLREQTRWLNTIITNGEQPISTDARAGAVNRVISIDASGEIIPGGKEGMGVFADQLRKNYGHAGKMIVDYIMENGKYKDKVRNIYKEAMYDLVKTVTGKQANYGAALIAGDAILNDIVFGCAFAPLKPDDILPYLATQDMVDTNKKAMEWLVSYVSSNFSKFHVESEDILAPNKSEILGMTTSNNDVLIIKGVLKEKLEAKGWVLVSFLQWCNQRGFLVTKHSETNRHWEVYRHIDGIEVDKVPVIHFKAKMFAEAEAKKQ